MGSAIDVEIRSQLAPLDAGAQHLPEAIDRRDDHLPACRRKQLRALALLGQQRARGREVEAQADRN